jgi:hypothetical protein
MAHRDCRQTILACLFRRLLLGALSLALVLAGPVVGSLTGAGAEEDSPPGQEAAQWVPVAEEEDESSSPRSAPRAARRISRRRSEAQRPIQPGVTAWNTQTTLFRSPAFVPSLHPLSAHPLIRGASLPLLC